MIRSAAMPATMPPTTAPETPEEELEEEPVDEGEALALDDPLSDALDVAEEDMMTVEDSSRLSALKYSI
jgi:hypothetical protein